MASLELQIQVLISFVGHYMQHQVCVVVSESVGIDTVSSITAQQCKLYSLHACTYSLGNFLTLYSSHVQNTFE